MNYFFLPDLIISSVSDPVGKRSVLSGSLGELLLDSQRLDGTLRRKIRLKRMSIRFEKWRCSLPF